MSQFRFAMIGGCFALFVLMCLEPAFGQSGSRNSYRPSRTPRISTEQQQFLQQQNAAQQQANAAQQRIQFLRQLSANPNSRENRTQYSNAYDDAKAEFMAIRNGSVPVSGSRLQRPFLLRSNELNRKARKIKWPKALQDQQHNATVADIEAFIKDMKQNAQELTQLISQLSSEVEQRVIAKTIDIKQYAKAKRFLSGLANETEL